MLDQSKTFSSFSVNDVRSAQAFYEEKLGLKTELQDMGDQELLTLKLKKGHDIMIYQKEDHQPATFTVLNFAVKDVALEVDALKEKGITFEHYEGNDDQEINHNGGMDVAWFKDPAGNFLSIVRE